MDIENRYGTLEIQKSLLILLKVFDDFCYKNNIVYSLDSGSLLGVIRHKGFIPWDDDLDVVMDRKNYNRLISCICGDSESINLVIERNTPESLWVDRIHMKNYNNDSQYMPTIDIFLFDNVPNNKYLAKLKVLFLLMLQGMMKPRLNIKKGNLAMKCLSIITWVVGLLIPRRIKYNWYNKVSSLCNKNVSTYGSCYNYPSHGMGHKFDSDVLDCIIRMPFESIEVPVMKKYDHYLTTIYGDYLTPPKKEERIPKHL
jgi:lipopolysaccharide cholinephosphotransferase